MGDDQLIRRLADELEIRNNIARLAQLSDHGDLEDYIAIFTEDASWEMPGAPRKGHADIRAGSAERRMLGTTGPGSNARHLLTTIAVDADGSDKATSVAYWQFWGDTTTEPAVRLMGVYRDTWLRQQGSWKLARREIQFG